MRLGTRVTLVSFVAAVEDRALEGQAPAERALEVPSDLTALLVTARAVVDQAAAGTAPVYGLNTGLGANLGHRIAPDQIAAFQRQLIEGRSVAVGPMLGPQTGRAMVLARLIGMAQGHSGVSLPVFDHLCAVWRAGLSPAIPRFGSIGAADLTQNATWALALLGQGQIWCGEVLKDANDALDKAGLGVPELQPKDAMALINHGGTTVALAGKALALTGDALAMTEAAALLSFQGYGANGDIFARDINALRLSPGQGEAAARYRRVALGTPNRVQDALSFRVLAPLMGAAWDAYDRAVGIWEDELNGASDSPAVVGAQAMRSTPNFYAPALALALETLGLAVAMVGQGAVQRMQRLMNPELSGLPRYLTPVGGASAGFVPLQKTAASLLGEIRRHAQPVIFDPAPVSDGVEDMAPMTPLAAIKLAEQADAAQFLAAIEALVAAQAVDLRGGPASNLHKMIRDKVAMLQQDRPLGQDTADVRAVLQDYARGVKRP